MIHLGSFFCTFTVAIVLISRTLKQKLNISKESKKDTSNNAELGITVYCVDRTKVNTNALWKASQLLNSISSCTCKTVPIPDSVAEGESENHPNTVTGEPTEHGLPCGAIAFPGNPVWNLTAPNPGQTHQTRPPLKACFFWQGKLRRS